MTTSTSSNSGTAETLASKRAGEQPSSDEGIKPFVARHLRRQAAVSAAVTGALGTLGGLVIQLAALLIAVATFTGVTVSAIVLQRLGVNVFDYVAVSDLPMLGLRFMSSFALLVALIGALGLLSALSAFVAAHAVQSHREALEGVRAASYFEKLAAWAASAQANWRAYVFPLLLAAAFVFSSNEILKTMVDDNVDQLLSDEACAYYVTWNAGAWSGAPPFSESHCAARIGVFGGNAILLVDGQVHTIPNAKVADISFRVGQKK